MVTRAELNAYLRNYPKMVKWFAPRLLAQAGFRHSIASLFGQYADQRTTQHLSDPIPEDDVLKKEFVERHNYAHEATGNTPFWVDYAADLGDGFDSTYAIAYMLAADTIYGREGEGAPGIQNIKELPGSDELKHGRILLMGGDQVYPWPSREEYNERLCEPYRLAFPDYYGPGKEPPRDLYAIPGNHDWYDGLASFDDLFCRARSGNSGRKSTRVGGWQTRQHRSYFAIKLPHDWWIWGADIQLNRYLDAGQLEYFRTVSQYMGPQDKFILCTAQPSWHYFGTPKEKYARENLRNLIDMPLRQGAKICTIVSGDYHHYSRYNESDELGNFNLITAGGGGAYAHGTHQLKSKIDFEWVGRELTFHLNRFLKPDTSKGQTQPAPKQTKKAACYPTKSKSRRLALGNLAFPLRNIAFCLTMGMVYWLLTWTFSELEVENPLEKQRGSQAEITKEVDRQIRRKKLRKQFRWNSDRREFQSIDPRPSPPKPAQSGERPIGEWAIAVINVFLKKVNQVGWFSKEGAWALLIMFAHGIYLLLAGIASSPLAFAFLFAVWGAFYIIADTTKIKGAGKVISKAILGSVHFWAHLLVMWALFSVLIYINRQFFEYLAKEGFARETILLLPVYLWEKLIYPVEMIILGGCAAGLIFGLYLICTYLIGKLHDDWAFSAQRIANHKMFLRMRFEPDKLTIYPISIDTVPRRRRWWSLGPSGWRVTNKPKPGSAIVEPRFSIKPRLIEGPVVIKPSEVNNIPRLPKP